MTENKENYKRILVVEQNALTSKVLKHLLTLWGYEFFLAGEGRRALDMVRRLTPNLILISFELSDLPAAKLIERLKQNPLTSYIPILLLIGHKRLRHQLLKEQIPFDDYLLTPPDPVELKLRMERTLRRTEQNLQANPLTRLPGGLTIEKEIEERIQRKQPLSVCLCDIDRFKAFNDAYGYDRGNGVLLQMARVLVRTIRAVGEGDDFVGHIGGDDFVVITQPSRQKKICLFVMREFDRLMPLHYTAKDSKRGYLLVKNRLGKEEQFPLMTLSIAVATNESRRLESVHQISEIASELKRFLKGQTLSESHFLIDRRQDPELPSAPKPKKEESDQPASVSRRDQKPLGQMLVEAKVITELQLEEALRRHWRSAQRLGQILTEMDLVSSEQLGEILSKQLGVPYVKLKGTQVDETLSEFPRALMEEHGVYPLAKKKDRLFIAMTDPLDRKIIRQVEKLVGCAVEPRLTTEADLQTVLRPA